MRCFALLVLLAGCDLYFNGGDDEPPCNYAALSPAPEYRNPETGECQGFGYPCDDRCGPCPAAESAIAQPDWGMCFSECSNLDEKTCMGTSGCFATYLEFPNEDRGPVFNGCWDTAPSGPVGGACSGLDAQECSRHDNCTAHYQALAKARTDQVGPLDFLFCRNEPPRSCSGVACPPNSHCDEQCDANGMCTPVCVADGPGCDLLDCGAGYECQTTCSPGPTPYCDSQCVPSTSCEALPNESSCKSRSDCTPVYKGEDCTCYPTYCECNILTYQRCETK